MNDRLVAAPPLAFPAFNDWRGGVSGDVSGPLEFDKVVMRYFPLEADVQALQAFCDSYLNLAPDFSWFRPAMPYVVLCVANYGSMGTTQGNLGWESQNEVLFGVPVEWHQLNEKGEMVFKNFAMVAPFIFVDSGGSEAGGREVFGWPKQQGWFVRSLNPWTQNPRAWRQLLRVDVQAFGTLFESERIQSQQLLAIHEKPPISYSLFPPSTREADSTLLDLPRNATEWINVAMHAVGGFMPKFLGGMGLGSFETLGDFLKVMLDPREGFVGAFHANTINLKQMRDASDPSQACFQGYTNAQMRVKRIRRGGLLGEHRVLRGEPGAGLRIRLHDLQTQPIVSTLGLKVTEDLHIDGERVSTLTPVLPFWVEADMIYTHGETLCFRTRQQPWRDQKYELKEKPDKVPYNTTGSAGFQVPMGPFRFPNATYRVMPMLANATKLQDFVDQYLNSAFEGYRLTDRFEAYGSYAYAVVTHIKDMSSKSDNLGVWAKSGLDVLIPVKWFENGRLKTVGLVSPFMFAESDIGVTTGREVNGWPTVMAGLKDPPNTWGTSSGPFADVVPLLNVHTDAMRVIGLGQEMDWQCVMEVVDGHPFEAESARQVKRVSETWGKTLRDNVTDLAARNGDEGVSSYLTVLLEILGNGCPVNQFSLKQFREASDFGKACYQAVVRSRSSITQWHELRELERPIYIKVHHYETLPLIDMLGLEVVCESADGSYSVVQPQRSFYMEVDLQTDFGEVLCQRSGSAEWSLVHLHDVEPASPLTKWLDELDEGVVEQMSEDPRDPIQATQMRKRQRQASTGGGAAMMEKALETFEPQNAIHEMLSRNWGNSRGSARGSHPSYLVREDSVGRNPPAWLFPRDHVRRIAGVHYWSPQEWPDT